MIDLDRATLVSMTPAKKWRDKIVPGLIEEFGKPCKPVSWDKDISARDIANVSVEVMQQAAAQILEYFFNDTSHSLAVRKLALENILLSDAMSEKFLSEVKQLDLPLKTFTIEDSGWYDDEDSVFEYESLAIQPTDVINCLSTVLSKDILSAQQFLRNFGAPPKTPPSESLRAGP